MSASEHTPHPGKVRHCWNCGANMGFIENRYFDRMDTCGARDCEREARNAFEEDRQAAHDAVDDYYGGGW
jgi:hypothetical protein